MTEKVHINLVIRPKMKKTIMGYAQKEDISMADAVRSLIREGIASKGLKC